MPPLSKVPLFPSPAFSFGLFSFFPFSLFAELRLPPRSAPEWGSLRGKLRAEGRESFLIHEGAIFLLASFLFPPFSVAFQSIFRAGPTPLIPRATVSPASYIYDLGPSARPSPPAFESSFNFAFQDNTPEINTPAHLLVNPSNVLKNKEKLSSSQPLRSRSRQSLSFK